MKTPGKNIIRTRKQAQEAVSHISSIIELHESMRNSYFWHPDTIASCRRSYEARKSDSICFCFRESQYDFQCATRCSAKNIYYSGYFSVDGATKDVRAAKKVLQKLEDFVAGKKVKQTKKD